MLDEGSPTRPLNGLSRIAGRLFGDALAPARPQAQGKAERSAATEPEASSTEPGPLPEALPPSAAEAGASPGVQPETAAKTRVNHPAPVDEEKMRADALSLFDAEWYLEQLGWNGLGVADPFEHFMAVGWRRGLDPHPLFDTDWYLARHPDVGAAEENPLMHYILHGAHEPHEGGVGRRTHPLLDIRAWCARHPEAAAPGEIPLRHFLKESASDLAFRPHPLLHTDWYAARWPSFGVSPLEHYVRSARETAPNRYFDTAWYVSEYMAGSPPRLSPLQHYVECWTPERPGVGGSTPSPHPLLDMAWYRSDNADVVAAGVDPLQHYLEHGVPEGRRPSPYFDSDFYRRRHRADALAQSDPLGHYLDHGQEDGCDPNPFFDNGWYARRNALGGLDALSHFVGVGEKEQLIPHPMWDEARYVAGNRELEDSKGSPGFRGGYRHFLDRGAAELARGAPRSLSFAWGEHVLDYDEVTYRADNPDVDIAIQRGDFRSGLEHWFVVGYQEARDGLRAIYGPRHQVRLLQDIAGQDQKRSRHLCLFAHYDRDSVIDPYVISYISSLRECDVAIIFVTATSTEDELDKVLPLVKRVIVKNEAGRDFGSWWLALKTLGTDCGLAYDRVIWANDSVYAPVRPLRPVFLDMERKAFNLYGLSDSREGERYHLQSFFIAFDRAAQTALFGEYCKRFETFYALPKPGQIREFEYGLTKLAQDQGLSVGAYLSIDDTRETLIHTPDLARWAPLVRLGLGNVNPTHDLWDVSIARLGWPGLKVELLRDNPRGLKNLDILPSLIGDGAVGLDAIEAHQARIKGPAALKPSPVIVSPNAPEVVLRARREGRRKPGAKRLVLFAHYDPDDIVDDHVVHQLRALDRSGCAICFITQTESESEIEKAAPYCGDILVKNGAGRDFGSWDLAIRTLGSEFHQYDSVIWMNDSTYFPLFDPGTMFSTMECSGADFWGVVDSDNVTWHVMSWFWSFSRRLIEEGWFNWYLEEYNPSHTKWGQIHNYEMRVPRLIRASGMDAQAYIPASSVRARILSDHVGHPKTEAALNGRFNMMHDFWKEIITDFTCPSIKVELVRDNPLGVDLSSLLKVIASHSDYDPNLIRNHMRRLKTAHLPGEPAPAPASLPKPSVFRLPKRLAERPPEAEPRARIIAGVG